MKVVEELIEYFIERGRIDAEEVRTLIDRGFYSYGAYEAYCQEHAPDKKDNETPPLDDYGISTEAKLPKRRTGRTQRSTSSLIKASDLVELVKKTIAGSEEHLRPIYMLSGKKASVKDWQGVVTKLSQLSSAELLKVLTTGLATGSVTVSSLLPAIFYRNYLDAVPRTARGPEVAVWRTVMQTPERAHTGKYTWLFQDPTMRFAHQVALVQHRLWRMVIDLLGPKRKLVTENLRYHPCEEMFWAFLFLNTQPSRKPESMQEKHDYVCFRSNWSQAKGIVFKMDAEAQLESSEIGELILDEEVAADAIRIALRIRPDSLMPYVTHRLGRKIVLAETFGASSTKSLFSFTYLWVPINWAPLLRMYARKPI